MKTSAAKLVLYADDDEDARLLLSRALKKANCTEKLVTVPDGADVISYFAGEGKYADRFAFPLPNLLLLDLKMLNISGFQVLEHFRTLSKPPECPIIIFSSSARESDRQKATELGSAGYIVKPSDFESLVLLVRKIGEDYLYTERRKTPAEAQPLIRVVELEPEALEPEEELPNLDEKPEIFKLLVDQVKDYGIFVLSSSGIILSWNEGARRIKGWEAREIIGKHFSTFYTRKDLEKQKPAYELRIASETGRYEEEGWRVRKDGSQFWANVVITALKGAGGRLEGFAKVTRDLTARKLHEEGIAQLLESEERFRLLVQNIKDYAIFMLDTKGKIASWNEGARRIKGYAPDEIIGQHFSKFYIPEDLADKKPARELSTAIETGRYEEEGWRLRKDGTRFWASVVITAVWDQKGNLTGFAKITRDLTKRRIEEEALKQRANELEAFAHTLSHDLKTPLRAISSYAQILESEKETLTRAELGQYSQRIVSSARVMDQLIHDLLRLAEIGSVNAVLEPVALEKVVAEVIEITRFEAERFHGEVQVRGPLPVVSGNRTLLVQAITNLVVNALKFTKEKEKPSVEISVTIRGEQCELHVKDNGCGIPEAHRASIFALFNRGEARTRNTGTGVGLAIVKRAMERMGGSVRVESEVEKGSEFILSLTCADVAAAESAA